MEAGLIFYTILRSVGEDKIEKPFSTKFHDANTIREKMMAALNRVRSDHIVFDPFTSNNLDKVEILNTVETYITSFCQ
jgi:hypothetical protein